MPKCQLGMQKNVQGHRIASVCKQTYDASCILTKSDPHLHRARPKMAAIRRTRLQIMSFLPLMMAQEEHANRNLAYAMTSSSTDINASTGDTSFCGLIRHDSKTQEVCHHWYDVWGGHHPQQLE